MQTNSNYVLVETANAFGLALINLRNATVLSIDSEFSGFYTYYSKVCLIQISANGKNYIIDPLKISKLDGLSEIFSDKTKVKIFHSCTDDMRIMKKDFGFEFTNVRDTMIGSRVLGMESNSLAHVVEYYKKIKLDKEQQKSNWEKRPLEKKQLLYAAYDTCFLEEIWNKMEKELQDRNLFEEAMSEFLWAENSDHSTKEKEGEGFHLDKFPNILTYSPRERKRIYEILKLRDEKAKKINKAPFRLLANDKIIKLASTDFNEEKYLQEFGHKDGTNLFQLLSNTTEEITDDDLRRDITDQLDDKENKIFQKLKAWREAIKNYRKMDHTMVPTNKILVSILKSGPKTLEELQSLNLFSEWKVQNYGPGILACLRGENYESFFKSLPQVDSKRKKVNLAK